MRTCFRDTPDPNHTVCISCKKAGVRCPKARKGRSKPRRRHSSGPIERDGRVIMLCRTDLRTPNDWNNRTLGQQTYLGERQKWTRLFRNVVHLWGPQPEGVRRRLTVTRIVPDRRFLIKDFDNRIFALKPLEDALKVAGVLTDDAEKYLEALPPRQRVDPACKEPVVEVILEDIEQQGAPN